MKFENRIRRTISQVMLVATCIGVPAFASVANAQGRCQSQAGQTVTLRQASEVVLSLSGGAATKGEFETTAEFQARKLKMAAGLGRGPIMIEITADRSEIAYDADRGQFAINRFAWSNLMGDFETVSGQAKLSPNGMITVLDETHGFGVLNIENPVGRYKASNAFGTTVEVVQIQRDLYSVFDRVAREGEQTWRYDYMEQGRTNVGGIFVPARRDVAPSLKDTMRFGLEFLPRDPFLVKGARRFEPNIDRPTDITESIQVLTGSLQCLLVLDKDGQVLKAVPAAY